MNATARLWDMVDEHLDESEFLLEQWLAMARSARFSRDHLQKTLEPRLIAHLDALAVGDAPVAERRLWPLFAPDSEGEPLRVAAAALAWLMDPAAPPQRLTQALVTCRNPAVQSGLAIAFQLCPRSDIDEPLRLGLYEAAEPSEQKALLAALAARRVDPGPILTTLLGSADASLLRAALAAASTAQPGPYRHLLEAHLDHPDRAARAAAIRTGLIWNSQAAWRACLVEARAGAPDAMLLAALLGGAEQVPMLVAALSTPHRPAALWALGFTGRSEAVEACLPLLADAEAGGLAVEAIAGITGLPLFDPPFVQPPEDGEGDELPPLEEDLRSNLTPTPLDELPAPNGEKVQEWWAQARARFPAGRRFIGGQPLAPASLSAAISSGPLRRTGPLACELAIRSAGAIQLPALRLGHAPAPLPADFPLQRAPSWR
jgi:uncharacterized protein (TIGR02270 family)